MDELNTDVPTESSPSVEPSGDADSSTVNATETSESVDNVQVSEEQAADDPLKDVPTIEELQAQVEQKIPYAAALANLRPAYESVKEQLGQFEPWKEVTEKIGDPSLALSSHELIGLLHSQSENGQETAVPFLQRIEQESPGTVDQIFADCLSFPVEINGQRDTLVRHLYRSHGLNPDNVERYKALDAGTLAVASGTVSSEQLAKIDTRYHDAFKSKSAQWQKDVLTLAESENENDRLLAQEYLDDAQGRLESRRFQEQIENDKKAQEESQRQEVEQTIQTESESAIENTVSEIYSSIYQNLASQVKISSNELENKYHLAGIMSNLYTLLDPAGRKLILEPLLKESGVSLDSTIAGVQVKFDDTVNRFSQAMAAAVRYEKYGDTLRARQAKAMADQSRQIITAKLNQIALKLAQPTLKPNGNNLGATARQVPNGNGVSQTEGENPYDKNPYQMGTPEYYAYIKNLDKQFSVAGGAVFTN